MKKIKIALLTGGPSLERGISLNSARSILDHLENEQIEIIPIYFDHRKKAYKISKAQLYSNTPSDFDFKLSEQGKSFNQKNLIKFLKKVDIVFPVMHGPFGEDGQIQSFLEKNKIPFIGSSSKACKSAFDKYNANQFLAQNNFYTLPSALLKIYDKDNLKTLKNFFKKYGLKRVVVKPATGGSSIGVFSATDPVEALTKAKIIFSKRIDTRVVIEPFAAGREFTVIILQNKLGLPVAIIPSEIEMSYHEGRIFDFRKKYLPTNQVKYHCPPGFSNEIIKKIQTEAEQLFSLFKMNDFARFDGWLLDNGQIWFSDFNPISGMEQNSFLFQQTSRLGMSHSDLLFYILKNACQRQKIKFPDLQKTESKNRKPVAVLFGGHTSERQVSLMSGTNVWLKLKKSKIYKPKPYLLDAKNNIWHLPYTLILNHTVEEIIANAIKADKKMNKIKNLLENISTRLFLTSKEATEPYFAPKKMSLLQFSQEVKFVFLGLHGGDGENGTAQKLLTQKNIKYNGSDEVASRLCMDKFEAGKLIWALKIDGISTAPQKVVSLKEVNLKETKLLWKKLKLELMAQTLIVKPKDDGCSTGVAHLYNQKDLNTYLHHALIGKSSIAPHSLKYQNTIIEMPRKKVKDLLFEKFIETDLVSSKANKLKHIRKSGWIEVTIGILEKKKKLHALNPSITIAEGEVLSLEEKFQGGTGINITPPPIQIVRKKALDRAKKLAEELATEINIKGYARIDAFMNITTGSLLVIEINTLPGLTPSTVIYHQALAEKPAIFPREFLEKIIKNAGY